MAAFLLRLVVGGGGAHEFRSQKPGPTGWS